MLFAQIIGQDQTKANLISAIQRGILPHALLFAGIEGCGKFELALAAARYLHCTNRQAEDACGKCNSCLKINKLVHPDLHFVFPIVQSKTKKKSICDDYLPDWRSFLEEHPYVDYQSWLQHIQAERSQGTIYARESNEIIKKLQLKAYESDYKVMLIWLPEKMQEATANKLLKILEEPPPHTFFFLVADEPKLLLSTIRSRAQAIWVKGIQQADLAQALVKRHLLGQEEAVQISRLANGSYTEACKLLSVSNELDLNLNLFKLIMRNSWSRDVKNMKVMADEFAALGRERQKNFIRYAQSFMRENYIYNLQIPSLNFLSEEEAGFSTNFAKYVNERNIEDLMQQLNQAYLHIEQNVNARIVFFDLSMKIAVLLKK